MSVELSRECLRLLNRQDRVLAIGQALEVGLTAEWIRNQVRYGRWQVMHRGVYAAFTGPAPRGAELWGALLRAGPDADFDHAYDWICRAIGRRLTTADRLLAALNARCRFRWRHDIELALGYAKAGALSVLELRYVRGVEEPHGLPTALRQVRVRQATGSRYLDNLYERYRACVEIDGSAAHPEDEQWRDKNRDRWNSVHELVETIRIGVPGLVNPQRQCETAAEVSAWLSSRDTPVGHPCPNPDCPVPPLCVPSGDIRR
jgi:hypothetical protein